VRRCSTEVLRDWEKVEKDKLAYNLFKETPNSGAKGIPT